ncbi:4-hydroxyphenylpyruvate dioxygenase [Micromonospora sp. NBC_01699]|uniref:4-hydroxyphenylpyruvate dioxygenase n=1 Tax=Micromonospora sp. NBC_01699 TaxID=2975984 RepID=UPI002E28839D|nr:4-hydroxyphenylpyruvate dioxygenase [Micromonospora sp. NBC_01699]
MSAQSLAYVELYVDDPVSVQHYFVTAMGFTHVADSVTDRRTSALLRQGDVDLIVTSGPVTAQFLAQHGDGIADIALTCDDVQATSAAARAAGARVSVVDGQPVISDFGAVRHTLVPAGNIGRDPAHRVWTPQPGAPTRPGGHVRLLDHVAICVAGGSLQAVADFYGAGLGLARFSSEYVDVGGQAMDSVVVRSATGEVTFTLVAPDVTRNPGQLDAFLERNDGPGVQHLAFLVDEILPAVAQFRERGVTFLSTPPTYYDMLGERFPEMAAEIGALREANVLADRDEWGYLLQLFSRSPYDRNTLFYELIQRRGSRGFGSRNIRALYEAVERDRLVTE